MSKAEEVCNILREHGLNPMTVGDVENGITKIGFISSDYKRLYDLCVDHIWIDNDEVEHYLVDSGNVSQEIPTPQYMTLDEFIAFIKKEDIA